MLSIVAAAALLLFGPYALKKITHHYNLIKSGKDDLDHFNNMNS